MNPSNDWPVTHQGPARHPPGARQAPTRRPWDEKIIGRTSPYVAWHRQHVRRTLGGTLPPPSRHTALISPSNREELAGQRPDIPKDFITLIKMARLFFEIPPRARQP